MKRTSAIVAALVVALGTTRAPADAATAKITSFAATSSGNLVFSLGAFGLTASAPAAYGFSLNFRTSATAGAIITVTAPTMVGTATTIPTTAFLATCTATSDPSGAFTSSGNVRLSGSAVTCGTLAINATETLTFDVTLTIDDNTDAFSSIPSDTYANGTLTVGANLP